MSVSNGTEYCFWTSKSYHWCIVIGVIGNITGIICYYAKLLSALNCYFYDSEILKEL